MGKEGEEESIGLRVPHPFLYICCLAARAEPPMSWTLDWKSLLLARHVCPAVPGLQERPSCSVHPSLEPPKDPWDISPWCLGEGAQVTKC